MQRLGKSLLVFIALVFFFQTSSAFANDLSASKKENSLRTDWKLDVAVTAIAASAWAVTSGTTKQIGPTTCRWCQVGSFDRWGRNNIKWSNAGAANTAVNIAAYGLAPATALGLDALAANIDGELSNFWIDMLLIGEASSLSAFTCQMVKFATARERPRAYFGTGPNGPEDNISFYSGHTALAFSLAASSGTVAWLRGYTLTPWIWGGGMAVAATVGYLSIASDRHYLTDVITGAAVGSAFGFGIPYLFHRPREKVKNMPMVSVSPTQGGGMLSVSGVW